MITIALETLNNKTLRATGRIDGRTVEYFEGSDAKKLVGLALSSTASAHAIPGGYDMTHIRLNDAALAAIAKATGKV